MKKFEDFNIVASQKSFVGDKIKIDRVLNIPIEVRDYKIEDSKYKGKCLYLQIAKAGTEHVVFTGATTLIDMIQKVPKEELPFETTIVKKDERFLFT